MLLQEDSLHTQAQPPSFRSLAVTLKARGGGLHVHGLTPRRICAWNVAQHHISDNAVYNAIVHVSLPAMPSQCIAYVVVAN